MLKLMAFWVTKKRRMYEFFNKKTAIRKSSGAEFGQSFHFGNNYKKILNGSKYLIKY